MKAPPTPYDRLSAWSGDALNVVIETPKGNRNKLAYDPELGLFVLKGVLPAGAVFPFDFGYIPATLGGDGDPLDVLVLMDEPAPVGCLVPCRLVGVIEAEQTERDGTTEKNDRLIAVASPSRSHESVASLDDVGQDLVREVEHFFESYNEIRGKRFRPTGRSGADRARELVEEGIRRAREGRGEEEEGG
jgi:inorganic pyrophosphatase